jgi:hypothetical protein
MTTQPAAWSASSWRRVVCSSVETRLAHQPWFGDRDDLGSRPVEPTLLLRLSLRPFSAASSPSSRWVRLMPALPSAP